MSLLVSWEQTRIAKFYGRSLCKFLDRRIGLCSPQIQTLDTGLLCSYRPLVSKLLAHRAAQILPSPCGVWGGSVCHHEGQGRAGMVTLEIKYVPYMDQALDSIPCTPWLPGHSGWDFITATI